MNDQVIEISKKYSKRKNVLEKIENEIIEGLYNNEYEKNDLFFLREDLIIKIKEKKKLKNDLLKNLKLARSIQKENKGINCDSLIINNLNSESFFKKQKEKLDNNFENEIIEIEKKKNDFEDIQWKINQIHRALLCKNTANHKMEVFHKDLKVYNNELILLNKNVRDKIEYNKKLELEVDSYEKKLEDNCKEKMVIIEKLSNEITIEKENQEGLKKKIFEKEKNNLDFEDQNKEYNIILKEKLNLEEGLKKKQIDLEIIEKKLFSLGNEIIINEEEFENQKIQFKNYIINNEDFNKNKKHDINKYFYYYKSLEEDKKLIAKETANQKLKNIYLLELIEIQKDEINNLEKKERKIRMESKNKKEIDDEELENFEERIENNIFDIEDEIFALREKLDEIKMQKSDITEQLLKEKISDSIDSFIFSKENFDSYSLQEIKEDLNSKIEL